MEISRESARKLMIEKQGIEKFPSTKGKEQIVDTIKSLGCLQIDTISVVERAQYLTLWSRLGNYEKSYLDESAYRDKKLFEYWAHAACFVPQSDYKYYVHAMRVRKSEMKTRFVEKTGKDAELLDQVLARINDEGPLCSKDFVGPKRNRGGWWNRKAEKVAMDYLYGAGILMICNRVGFQRYYDLTKKVLPSWVETEPPSDDDRIEFFTRKTLQCLGAIKPIDVRKYYYHHSIKLGQTSKQLEERLKVFKGVKEFSVEGDKNTHYCLDEDLERLQTINDDFNFDDVRLLVYFDNLMWNRERIQHLFGFESKLEIYIPHKERVYGYYHLPVLFGDQIVARIEPKMDRKKKKLIIRGYWTKPRFKETDEYRDKLEKNLEDFAVFHGAEEIEWLS